MSAIPLIKKIHLLIKEDKLEEATQLLIDTNLENEAITILRRIKELDRKNLHGTLSREEYSVERNKISISLLDLANRLDHSNVSTIDSLISAKNFPSKIINYKLLGIITFVVLTIVAITIFFMPINQTYTVTVLVHGKGGKDDCVLPNRGEVTLRFRDNFVTKQINNECEITFRQVNQSFFGKKGVEITFKDPEGEAYRANNPDSIYFIHPGEYIALEVNLTGLDTLQGVVKDDSGKLLVGVTIMVQELTSISNENGYYKMFIPEGIRKTTQTIRAKKKGYKTFEITNVPILKGQEIPIIMTPQNKNTQ